MYNYKNSHFLLEFSIHCQQIYCALLRCIKYPSPRKYDLERLSSPPRATLPAQLCCWDRTLAPRGKLCSPGARLTLSYTTPGP